jgi:hypothetical protein
MKYIKGFFAFWYDFIVGDSWEVAVGVLLTLVALYLLTHYASSSLATIGALLFPLIIVALLAYSLWRVRGSG